MSLCDQCVINVALKCEQLKPTITLYKYHYIYKPDNLDSCVFKHSPTTELINFWKAFYK